jgi:hypothetical protein
MKTNLTFMRLSVVILVIQLQSSTLNSQTLLIENFNYVSGTTLTSNGWNAHDGSGTNPVMVSSPGLLFPGYVSSNIGLSALLANNGEDVNKTFLSVTSGDVYCAFLMQVNSVSTDYFLHFSNSGISSNRGRIFIKGSGNSFNLGLSKGAETASYTTGSPYSTGTTYLLVMKYSIVDGATNDNVSLYIISGSIPTAEPGTPSIGPASDASQSDLTSVSAVALRQYSSSQNIVVDGIRIAQKWGDAVGISTGSDNYLVENRPIIFPVPASEILTISNIRNVNTIEIIDISGRNLIIIKTESTEILKIPISHLLKGLYFIKFRTSEGSYTMKFIKS